MEDFCAAIGKTRSLIPHHTAASGRWQNVKRMVLHGSKPKELPISACETINGLTEVRVLTWSGGHNKRVRWKIHPMSQCQFLWAFESHTETSENFEKASLQLVHPTHGNCGPRDNVRMTHGSIGWRGLQAENPPHHHLWELRSNPTSTTSWEFSIRLNETLMGTREPLFLPNTCISKNNIIYTIYYIHIILIIYTSYTEHYLDSLYKQLIFVAQLEHFGLHLPPRRQLPGQGFAGRHSVPAPKTLTWHLKCWPLEKEIPFKYIDSYWYSITFFRSMSC